MGGKSKWQNIENSMVKNINGNEDTGNEGMLMPKQSNSEVIINLPG